MSHYNKAATELDPPEDIITWKMISSTEILSNINILRGSRQRILDQDWAKPHHRRLVATWHRFQHAEEEIQRLDVELKDLMSRSEFTGAREIGIRIGRHEDEFSQCNTQETVSDGGTPLSNDSRDTEFEDLNEAQYTDQELNVGEFDEEVISEQLGQWHLALERADSDMF
ncbi:hypothetical protein FRC11_002289 [Ceratobasidium sp. 423]|nr:hypothetical protein FRC11_002289 [Ceratobasidium sp. 423]